MINKFEIDYAKLEEEFKSQVKKDRQSLECDDIVYLPLFPKPARKADFIFIAMEPSLTKLWAGDPPNRQNAESQVYKGFRNCMPFRFEDAILHYCPSKYLFGSRPIGMRRNRLK